MRFEENILLMRSKTLFRSQQSLDWKEIAELTAGVLDRWKIKMALFDLDGEGNAGLKFHSMDEESEKWWETISGNSIENLSVKLSDLPPMEAAVVDQKVLFVPNLLVFKTSVAIDQLRTIHRQKAIFAPLINEEKPFGVLVAMSYTLSAEDTLIVSLIAHELSTMIGGSELIRELRESRQLFQRVATKYRDLIDRLDDAIIMANGEGWVLAANERLRISLGYSYHELLKMKMEELVSHMDRELLEEAMMQARKSATSLEISLCDRNGGVVNTEAVITYSPEADTYQGTFRRQKASREEDESKLRERWLERVAEKRTRKKKDYELLMDGVLDGFPGLLFFMNPDGKIVYVNSAAENSTGYTREELMLHPLRWLERVHPEDREKVALAYQKALLTGEGHKSLAFKFHNKYGKECDFVSVAIPMRDSEGNLLGIQGMFQDISSVIEKEHEDGDGNRRQSGVFDFLNDLIFVFDLSYVVRLVNPACETFFGMSIPEMMEMPLEKIIAAEDMETLKRGVRIAIENGQVERLIIPARRKNGEEIFLEINASPVIEDGRPVAIRGVARNVTERVLLEKRERELQQELASKEKMAAIGEMLAAVSHGIRNPLASIRAIAQNSVLELDPGDKEKQRFKNIMLEADRLEMRIREFLSFYKPFEPDLKPCSINDIITETLNMVAAKEKDRKLKLDLKLDWKLPPMLLDFAQIEQVLLNLISNAFAAMNDGDSLRISSSKESSTVKVAIEDSGPGISPEVEKKIFQPFFTTKPQGTGMGLSVSKKMIENHGGTISLEKSRLGGAKFVFQLPIMELDD